METILLVGDEPGFRATLERFLTAGGYDVECAGSMEEGVVAGERRGFHLLISVLGDQEGMALLRWFAARAPETPCLVALEPGNGLTVEALALGAEPLAAKPVDIGEALRTTIRRVLDRAAAASERELLRDGAPAQVGLGGFLARDRRTVQVVESAGTLAALSVPVLIQGERGTGKEMLARSMHSAGARAGRSFAAVDCSAHPTAAVERELFGHADQGQQGGLPPHAGRAERAHLGTLFLEEVGALAPALQGRVWRLLEEGICERTGSSRRIGVDVRFIASTGLDLGALAAHGRFRQDLYQLLSITSITIPPLRERQADIPALARLFLSRAARQLRLPEVVLSEGAEEALQLYDWPGNVRELANLMERLALVCKNRVDPGDLPFGAPPPQHELPLRWKEIERQAIVEALRMNGGNRTRAARQLDISLRTLQYRLKEWSAAAR